MRIPITTQAPSFGDEKNPPTLWRQRVRRGLPFAPGRDGERFEIRVVEPLGLPRIVSHLNLDTLEVYVERADGRFDAPPWLELPPSVRRAIVERAPRTQDRSRPRSPGPRA